MSFLSKLKRVAKAPVKLTKAVIRAPVKVLKTVAKVSPPILLARAAVKQLAKPKQVPKPVLQRAMPVPKRPTIFSPLKKPIVVPAATIRYAQPTAAPATVAAAIRNFATAATGVATPVQPAQAIQQAANYVERIFSPQGSAEEPERMSPEDEAEAYAPSDHEDSGELDYSAAYDDSYEDDDEYTDGAPIDALGYLQALGNVGDFKSDLLDVAKGFGKDVLVSAANRGADLATKSLSKPGPSAISLVPASTSGLKISNGLIIAGAAGLGLLFLLSRKRATPSA